LAGEENDQQAAEEISLLKHELAEASISLKFALEAVSTFKSKIEKLMPSWN